ncbi:hypothetical protein C1H46_034696 [Malus baccata]|uniref:Secreted protein n=1 Tax=Malus baccata TaxID=106549 RepID=A0A540KZR7_MALBA|nr:hypothetical protein C1H46_034696 [Malus baccata]
MSTSFHFGTTRILILLPLIWLLNGNFLGENSRKPALFSGDSSGFRGPCAMETPGPFRVAQTQTLELRPLGHSARAFGPLT